METMLDHDVEILYAKNLELFDSLESLLSIETDQEARQGLIVHLEALDLILDMLEDILEKKDATRKELT